MRVVCTPMALCGADDVLTECARRDPSQTGIGPRPQTLRDFPQARQNRKFRKYAQTAGIPVLVRGQVNDSTVKSSQRDRPSSVPDFRYVRSPIPVRDPNTDWSPLDKACETTDTPSTNTSIDGPSNTTENAYDSPNTRPTPVCSANFEYRPPTTLYNDTRSCPDRRVNPTNN